MTPNGKVDRLALPSTEASRTHLKEAYVAPRSPVEEILVSLWAEVLGLKQVGIHDNFFELGGHSLLATQLISRVRDVLQLELPLRYLFEAPTPSELADCIAVAQGQTSAVESSAIVPVAHNTDLPLSFAQQRLWFLDQLVSGNPFYNMPFAWHVRGQLDVLTLQSSLNEIIHRHETLRTCFLSVNGQPTQWIASSLELTLVTIDLVELPEAERFDQARKMVSDDAQQPFDLTQLPLLRVKLLRLAPNEHILLLVMHHIISDGWSMGIFFRELAALYEAFSKGTTSPLAELPVQYADFAVWQRQWLSGEVLQTQLNYWQQQLAGAPPILELPTDRPRPSVQAFQSGIEQFQLDRHLMQKLLTLSQQSGTTLFMNLLAAFVTLLSRYSGQEDIVVGSPIANRKRIELEGLIGFFANTLALRVDVSGNPTFQELLGRVREVTIGAYAHQDLPFEKLVEVLQLERSLNRNMLVQVMFALHNAPTLSLELPGLSLIPFKIDLKTVRFDLEVHLWEVPEGLSGYFIYSTDLYDASTIQRMLGHFQTLLEGIVANCEQQISELPLLKEAERQQLLVSSNDVQADTVPGNEEQILAQLDGLSDDEVNALLNQMLVE